MSSAVITSAVRTAVGTARKGSLVNVTPEKLATTVVGEAVRRAGISPDAVDDVILAEALAGGGDIARFAAAELGMMRAGGVAMNRHCASSLTTVGFAAATIISGMENTIVAGGTHSSSFMPQMRQRNPETGEFQDWWIPPTHPETPDAPCMDMSITVGWNTAKAAGLTREDQDAWALRSHERAISAIDEGRFEQEIVPIEATLPTGETIMFKVDEFPRRGTTMEKLASLKVLHPEIEGFSVTAGNASGINDAAAALVITSEDSAKAEGSEVLAKIKGWTSIGIEPRLTGMAVPDVINKLASRAKFDIKDVKVWEINEAFASVPVAACRAMGLDEEYVNMSGSGCSIGHPIAASGARMLTTLITDLKRMGGGLGVAAMCAGGGQAGAVLIEV